MPTIKVEYNVEVQAGAERLWGIFTNVQSWPEWQGTSYIKPITSGPVKEGFRFVAELSGLKWNLIVTKAERPYRVCWAGRRLGIKAIHEWEFLEEGGKTKAVTRESMSGWTLLLMYPIVKARLTKYDEKWLADLKSKAESL